MVLWNSLQGKYLAIMVHRIQLPVLLLPYLLDDWAFIPGRGRDFFYLPPCPDWLCGPPIFLSYGY
jgi:hypothetical protein